MKRYFSRLTKLFGLIWVLGSISCTRGDDTTGPSAAAQPWTILHSQQVTLPTHKVTFNRVATPLLKPQISVGGLSVVSIISGQNFITGESLDFFFFSFGATIYDNGVTEIDWPYQGQDYVFWTNLNLNYVRNTPYFQVGDTGYELAFSAGNESIQNLQYWNAEVTKERLPSNWIHAIPTLPSSSNTVKGASYFLISPATGAAPEVLRAMTDLHSYYNANVAKLAQAYQDSQAKELLLQQELAAHPPKPNDIVINFFPIKSTHVPADALPGAKP